MKILIVTYYFEPCNYVAANRPTSFAKFLAKKDIQVTVVTRHWRGNEKCWEDIRGGMDTPVKIDSTSKNLFIHYLPYEPYRYELSRIKSKIDSVRNYFSGNLNVELNVMQFKDYVFDLCRKSNFDYVWVSVPPISGLKMASEINKVFGTKYLLDVRDFENDVILTKNNNFNLRRRFDHVVMVNYTKNWLKSVSFVTTVSPQFTEYFKKISHREILTIFNGYDDFFEEIDYPQNTDQFNVSVLGTLYDTSDISIMCDGFRKLFTENKDIKVKVNLIGVGLIISVAEKFKEVIPKKNLCLTDRIPKLEALKIGSQSHVLLLAGFKKMNGVFPTKFFEYVGLKRFIIQAPDDGGLISQMIKEMGLGKCVNDSNEFCEALINLYYKWRKSGCLLLNDNSVAYQKKAFSRNAQYETVLSKLLKGQDNSQNQ